MKLRKEIMESIDYYDSITVNVDEDGLLINRFESYNGKDNFNMIIMTVEEAKKLAKEITDKVGS